MEQTSSTVMKRDDFRFIIELGSGAYGSVCLAECASSPRPNKLFAVKTMAPSLKSDIADFLENEVRVLKFLTDRRNMWTPRIYYVFSGEDRIYVAMEHVDGINVSDLLTMFDPTEAQIRALMAEVFAAVHGLHSEGIMHRDLKPENIMLTVSGHIKLIDFGFGKFGMADDDTTDTSFGGTLPYMAPEMFSASHTRMVDWWAYACILFEMFCGQTPFWSGSEIKTRDNILKAAPKQMFVPDSAWDLIRSMLEKEPAKRLGYKKAGAIAQHAFFSGTRWENVGRKELEMPFKPKPRNFGKSEVTCRSFDVRDFDFEAEKTDAESPATANEYDVPGFVNEAILRFEIAEAAASSENAS